MTAKSSGGGEERGGEEEEPTKSQSVIDFIASDWSEVVFFFLLPPRFFLLFLFFSMVGFWNRREFDRQRESRKENMLKQNWENKNKRKKTVASDRPVRLDRNPYLFWLHVKI